MVKNTNGTLASDKTLKVLGRGSFVGILIVGGTSNTRSNVFLIYLTATASNIVPLLTASTDLVSARNVNEVTVKNNGSSGVLYSLTASKEYLENVTVTIN